MGVFPDKHAYFFSLQIVNIGLPIAPIQLVPGSGVKLAINQAFINLRGKWSVKYLRRM